MAHAKYTFFEQATQHGYIASLLSGRVAKSREFCKIHVDDRGRVYQVLKTASPDTPFFEFVIPEREVTESVKIWEIRVKKLLDKQWAQLEAERAARRVARSGTGTTASSELTPSKTESLSTDVPPKPESLSGPSVVEALEIAVSAPEPSTPAFLPTEPTSSSPSAPQSRLKGSKSPSSRGASTGKSG